MGWAAPGSRWQTPPVRRGSEGGGETSEFVLISHSAAHMGDLLEYYVNGNCKNDDDHVSGSKEDEDTTIHSATRMFWFRSLALFGLLPIHGPLASFRQKRRILTLICNTHKNSLFGQSIFGLCGRTQHGGR